MSKHFWTLKQSADADALELYIYGDVDEYKLDTATWSLVPSENSAQYFRDELAKYPGVQQINVYINSYGGSVFEGTAIYNQLKRHAAHKTVYVDGFACSIASVIAMAGDEIVMPRNTMMMIHNMWTEAWGNAAELRKAADDLDIINAAGRQAYLAKAGDKLSEDKLSEMMDAATWLTAEECVAYGLADRIAEQDADMSEAASLLQKVNAGMERQLQYQKNLAARLRELTIGTAGNGAGQRDEPQQGGEPAKNKVLGLFA